MPHWDCSPTARHRSFTPIPLLSHCLEAEVGIDPLSPCLRGKNARFHWVINLNLLNSTELVLTILVSVLVSADAGSAIGNRGHKESNPRDYYPCGLRMA